MNFLQDNDVAILFVTETWLTDQHNNTTAQIKDHGYKIHHFSRSSKIGGGVALIYRSTVELIKVHITQFQSFEAVSAKLKMINKTVVLCTCIYRPPGPLCSFLTEFEDFLSYVFEKFEHSVICGDVNMHLDKTSAIINDWNTTLSSFGLQQLVTTATHKKGHILDPVISSPRAVEPSSVAVDTSVSKTFPKCDHYPIIFKFQVPAVTNKSKKIIQFRNLKGMNQDQFSEDLANVVSNFNCDNMSFQNSLEDFHRACESTLDIHAPQITKTISDVPEAPWFDGEYKIARAQRRKAEKDWKKSKLEIDHSIFINIREHCDELALRKKKSYFKGNFQKYQNSQKSLYKFVDTFLDKDNALTLPSAEEDLQVTVNSFNKFFTEKTDEIRSSFPLSISNHTPGKGKFKGTVLSDLRPTTVFEIELILKEISMKTSAIDPLPKELLSKNLKLLLPTICDIVNLSLTTGSMEGSKLAHLTPLIKGLSLDKDCLKNYRPISNLTFIGKLIERVVLRRLNEHLKSNDLNITPQSGYKKHHSTETLLVTIVNDLLVASHKNTATVVMLLDLSAAFDTVDHSKLLFILENEIGIQGTALKWFRSFITGRCQKVKIGQFESEEIIIRFGVPQGSVLGPILFNIYIRSIYSTVTSKSFNIHGFADDHQIYKSFNPEDEYQVLCHDLPKCFQEIEKWMSEHFLLLNPGKTEIIVFGPKKVLTDLEINGVFLTQSVCIRLITEAKNLGFTLDSSLRLDPQIKKLKASVCHKLRNISKMKQFLSEKQLQIITQALVISSLDYCNAIYIGANKGLIKQLQSLQNRACRIIKGLKKREVVDQHLFDLHWLKIQERIEFKVLLLTFKCIHGLAPQYLSNLVEYSQTSCRNPQLATPSCSPSKAFSSAAPKLWNNLPSDIKQTVNIEVFKSKLKAHLFRKCYDIF